MQIILLDVCKHSQNPLFSSSMKLKIDYTVKKKRVDF